MLAHGYRYNGNPILDGAICMLFESVALTGLGVTAGILGLMVITLELPRVPRPRWPTASASEMTCVARNTSTQSINQSVITLERYCKIVHAIAHRKYYRSWMTTVGVVLPWFGGMCLILFPAMGTSRIVNGRCLKLAVWPHKAMGFVSRPYLRTSLFI